MARAKPGTHIQLNCCELWIFTRWFSLYCYYLDGKTLVSAKGTAKGNTDKKLNSGINQGIREGLGSEYWEAYLVIGGGIKLQPYRRIQTQAEPQMTRRN